MSTDAPLGWQPRFEPVAVADDGLFLLAENDTLVFPGAIYAELAPRIGAGCSRDAIVESQGNRFGPAAVHFALDRLAAAGALVEAPVSDDRRVRAFLTSLSAEPRNVADARVSVAVVAGRHIDPSPLCAQLTAMGMVVELADEPTTCGLSVIITDDYLSPGVRALALANRAKQRACLLVRPDGATPWIGPLLADATACFTCTAEGLRGTHPFDTYLERRTGETVGHLRATASLPASTAAALNLAAVEVVKWAVGKSPAEPAISVLDLNNLALSRHPVRRRPQCPDCGDPLLQTARMVRALSLGDGAWAKHGIDPASLVDPLLGIVRSVSSVVEPPLPGIHVRSAAFGFERDAQNMPTLLNGLLGQAAGVGTSDGEAFAGAVFEAVERTSGMWHGDEPSVVARFDDLDPVDVVDPRECMQYSDEQYAHRRQINARGHAFEYVPEPFDNAQPMHWTGVWSLSRQRFRLLPSTYLFYNHPQPPGGPYCWADSNGCAAGESSGDAVRRGLLELVERDAVALWWYNRVSRPSIPLGTLGDPYVAEVVELYRSLGRELWVLDITSDLAIPTVAAISRRTGGATEDILVSFGAHFSVADAVRHAVCELNHLLPAVLPEGLTEWGDYRYSEAAQRHWWRTATLASEPYLAPDGVSPLPAEAVTIGAPEQLQQLVRVIEAAGHEILVLDQTRPDIGIPVVKVIVPGLRHFWSRFAPGRLYDVPVAQGWLTRPTAEADLNPTAIFV